MSAGGQRLEDEHLRTGQKRRIDLERRILGCRANEHDVACLDAREKRVLLRLVEAVDLVDEQNRPTAGRTALPLGRRHDFADVLDAREHRAELHEMRAGHSRDDAGERGLARARRSPEDDRLQEVALDRLSQRHAGRENVLLTHALRRVSAAAFVRRAACRSLAGPNVRRRWRPSGPEGGRPRRRTAIRSCTLPPGGVNENRARDRYVERFDWFGHRDCDAAHPPARASASLNPPPSPPISSATRPRQLTASGSRPSRGTAATTRPPWFRIQLIAASTVSPAATGSAQDAPHAASHGLPGKRTRRRAANEHAGDTAGFSRAYQRAEIARVLHVDGDQNEAVFLAADVFGLASRSAGNRDDAGWCADRAHRGECRLGDGEHSCAIGLGGASDLGFLGDRRPRGRKSRRLPVQCPLPLPHAPNERRRAATAPRSDRAFAPARGK